MKKEQLLSLKEAILGYQLTDETSIDQFKEKFLHREKGEIKQCFTLLPTLPIPLRKTYGPLLNELKELANERHLDAVKRNKANQQSNFIDPSLPSYNQPIGKRHILSEVYNEISNIFMRVGFNISKGNIIEDDFHNFVALGFPKDHPAREMQDTFYLDEQGNHLLRTHTSPVQIRMMKSTPPPVRAISMGAVFRNEAISARTHCMFHQIEGFYVDKKVSFTDLKEMLYYFCRQFFGKEVKLRLRPSYFPFTEPSAEVDIACTLCEEGCNVCKYSRWIEIGGAGLIDPIVMKQCDLEPKSYSGYAFGMGIERLAMLKYKIDDVRLFLANDFRFLNQYVTTWAAEKHRKEVTIEKGSPEH